MKLLNITDAEKNQKVIEFSVDKATFDAAVDKAYKKNVAKLNVPGFRRGKAPKSMIEKMYGKGFFYEEAINDILPVAYEAALAESKLDVVSQPEIDIKTIDENGVVITALVYVKPEVKLGEYKGLAATREDVKVTDEAIDAEIAKALEGQARETEVTDRACEMGDEVVFDFDGYVDGVAFDGGKSENYSLKLGSGAFIPGFEEQIVGKNIADEFDVNVTFPEDYQAKELAGKPVVFKVKLNSLKKEELPELDDEFAKYVSEFETLSEYKESVKAKLQERNDKAADAEVEEKLVNALLEKMSADIPEAMFKAETENMVRDYDSRLRMQGLDLSTYFKYTGLDLDKLREQLRPQAEKQVKVRLTLEKIAKTEKLTATKKEIDAEYKRISEAYNVPVDDVKGMVSSDDIAADLKVKAALDLVKEKAVIKEK